MRRWVAITILVLSVVRPLALAQDGEGEARRISEKRAPIYPELGRRMNLEGVVRLRVTVAPDGKAKLVEVAGGNPVLAKAAQDAVTKWKWVPAPQETKEVIQLNFRSK